MQRQKIDNTEGETMAKRRIKSQIINSNAGSGSIPFAAKELQRRYIAIEANDKAAELCSKRLGQKIAEKVRL